MDGYACALRFDTDASEFVRGVEVGRLWEIVRNTEDVVEEFVHSSNAEMVMRIADALGRRVLSEELDNTWLLVRFETA